MDIMKKPMGLLTGFIIFLIAFLTVGCEGNLLNEEKHNVSTFRLVTDLPTESQGYQQLLLFAEMVQEKSDGQILIKLYSEDQWSESKSYLSYLALNTIEMACLSTNEFMAQVPQYEIFNLPYLFDNEADVAQYFLGAKGQEALALIDSAQFQPLGFVGNGYLYFVHNAPVLEGFHRWKGMSLAIADIPLYQQSLKTVGITPLSLSDGGKGQGWCIDESAVQEKIALKQINEGYSLNDPDMFYQIQVVLGSPKWWQSLSEDEKDLLQSCFNQAQQTTMAQPKTLQQQFPNGGITLVPLTAEEKSALALSTRGIVEQYLMQGTNSLASQWITPPVDIVQ